MTPTEAIDAMEGLGHDFFVFRDRNSNTIQVSTHSLGNLCSASFYVSRIVGRIALGRAAAAADAAEGYAGQGAVTQQLREVSASSLPSSSKKSLRPNNMMLLCRAC